MLEIVIMSFIKGDFYAIVRYHTPGSSRHKCFVGGVRMMHRNLSG